MDLPQFFAQSMDKKSNFDLSKEAISNSFRDSIIEAHLRSQGILNFAKSTYSMSDARNPFQSSSQQPKHGNDFSKSYAAKGRTFNQSSSTTSKFAKSNGSRISCDAYKTILCSEWKMKNSCSYADKCKYAHGETDLRSPPQASPFYKTVLCINFENFSTCPHGSRCNFIHRRKNDDSKSSSNQTSPTESQKSWDLFTSPSPSILGLNFRYM